jgi:hypothetical protein
MSVTVITPTTGAPELVDALIGVANQDYDGPIEHLVVVDGQEFVPGVERAIEQSGTNPTVMVLPNNTGAGGWNGHRIYASVPFLIDSKYIAFLDQDNWFLNNHVSSLVSTIENDSKLKVAFSLRSLFDKDKNYIDDDNCESLGKWPVWNSNGSQFLIDTSCFLFETDFIQHTARFWNVKLIADRNYTMHLYRQHAARYGTSGLYTMCYRLGGTERSVSKEFLLVGNAFNKELYKNKKFPWLGQ